MTNDEAAEDVPVVAVEVLHRRVDLVGARDPLRTRRVAVIPVAVAGAVAVVIGHADKVCLCRSKIDNKEQKKKCRGSVAGEMLGYGKSQMIKM